MVVRAAGALAPSRVALPDPPVRLDNLAIRGDVLLCEALVGMVIYIQPLCLLAERDVPTRLPSFGTDLLEAYVPVAQGPRAGTGRPREGPGRAQGGTREGAQGGHRGGPEEGRAQGPEAQEYHPFV